MATAKVVTTESGQAVQLPKEIAINADEVEVFRRGDEIVLKARSKAEAFFAALDAMPDDMIEALENAEDPPPQERKS